MSENKRKAPNGPPFAILSKRSKRSPNINTAQTALETSQVSVSLRRDTTLRLENSEPKTSKLKEMRQSSKQVSLPVGKSLLTQASKKAESSKPFQSPNEIEPDNSIFMPNIPSGLTKLALTPTTSMFRLSVSAADLVTTIGDDEMMAALASLKSVDLDTIPLTELTRPSDYDELKLKAHDKLNNGEESDRGDGLKPDEHDTVKTEGSTDRDELIERGEEVTVGDDYKSDASATKVADASDLKSSPEPHEDKSADGLNDMGKSAQEENETEKDIVKTAKAAHSSDSVYEVALSICHSKEPGILFTVKEVIKKLQESVPGIRIAVICHGGSSHNPYVQWIDFNTSREEIFTFIDAVPRTNQPVGVKAAELIKQVGKETLSWSPGSYRSFDRIGTLFRFDTEETVLKLLRNLGLRKDKASLIKTVPRNLGLTKVKSVSSKAAADSDVPVLSKGVNKPTKRKKNNNHPSRQKTNERATRTKPETCNTAQKNFKQAMRSRTASKAARTERKRSQISIVADGHKKTNASRMISTTKEIQKRSKTLAKKQPDAENPLSSNPRTRKKTFREELTDAQFNTGVMKKLKWTDWFLTMCNTIPIGYSRIEFTQPRGSEYSHRQGLASKLKAKCFYEFGVKLARCKMIIPVCLQHCWNTKGDKGEMTRHILRNKKSRLEVDRLLKKDGKIYIRGAAVTGKGKDTELAISNIKSQLKTIDYAWSRHGNGGHRKLIRNKIIISDDTL